MSDLITLSRAKTHLRVTHDRSDDEIQLLVDTAEAIVFEYIGKTYTEIEDDLNTFPLEAAILLVVTNLYDNRSDNPLSRAVTDLLRRWRDPAIG